MKRIKNITMLLFCTLIILSLVACNDTNGNLEEASQESAEEETEETIEEEAGEHNSNSENIVYLEEPETKTVRWNSGTSGNVLVTIANEKGYFEELGLEIENVPADANADAMTMLATGKVDVVSNSGTSNPLQQISSGVDISVFGGHMVQGAMPVIAHAGTEWNGITDLVGKKFACNPSYFAFTGALMDAGVEDPLEEVEWLTYTNYNDALAAVVRGEVDYALMGTGQCHSVKNMDEVDIVTFHGDVMPNYSCCRMVAQTSWIDENPTTVKNILIALIRAQEFYETNKEEALSMHAKEINAEEDYVAAYMLDEHYIVHVDPLRKSVDRAWGILDKTGFLDENAQNIDIDEHVNTQIYLDALAEAKETFGQDSEEFYSSLEKYFEENN